MTINEFYALIETGSLNGVYILEGPEEYKKEEAVRLVREKLLVPGFEMLNENLLESCSIQEIIDSAETLPFMCDKRLVIAKDPDFLIGSSEAEKDKEKTDRLIKTAWQTSVVLLYIRGKANEKKAAYKAFSKAGRTVSFELLSENELITWAGVQLKKMGHAAKHDTLNELVFMTGRQLRRLDIEINKLSAMVGKRKEITIDDVNELVVPDTEVSVFSMIDALTDKKAVDAYRLLNGLLDSGENSVRLLAMITRQLRLFAHIAVLRDSGLNDAQSAEKLGEKYNYPFKKAYKAVGGIKLQKLINCYRKSVEADYRIKSGGAEAQPVLEEMMYLLYNLKG